MTSAKKIFLAVSGGLVALGLVLVAVGFAASGFDVEVFSTRIDLRDDTINIGGTEVDDPAGLPLIEQLAKAGDIEVTAPVAPAAATASSWRSR